MHNNGMIFIWALITGLWKTGRESRQNGLQLVRKDIIYKAPSGCLVCGFRFLSTKPKKMRCLACSWSRPSGSSRISFAGHLSSGFHHRAPLLLSLSFPSSCDASLLVSCSSTSGPSDPKDSSNRSYSRKWHNPLPRRRHADQMPTSRIARDWIDSDTSPVSQGST